MLIPPLLNNGATGSSLGDKSDTAHLRVIYISYLSSQYRETPLGVVHSETSQSTYPDTQSLQVHYLR